MGTRPSLRMSRVLVIVVARVSGLVSGFGRQQAGDGPVKDVDIRLYPQKTKNDIKMTERGDTGQDGPWVGEVGQMKSEAGIMGDGRCKAAISKLERKGASQGNN